VSIPIKTLGPPRRFARFVQDNSFFWAPRGEGEPSALKRARHASVAEAITHTSSDITLALMHAEIGGWRKLAG
jgi:hypothetical protein